MSHDLQLSRNIKQESCATLHKGCIEIRAGELLREMKERGERQKPGAAGVNPDGAGSDHPL
jgi:hypothetical protein